MDWAALDFTENVTARKQDIRSTLIVAVFSDMATRVLVIVRLLVSYFFREISKARRVDVVRRNNRQVDFMEMGSWN